MIARSDDGAPDGAAEIARHVTIRLRDSLPVVEALGRLANLGLRRVDDVKRVAADEASPTDARLDAIVAVLALGSGGEGVLRGLLGTPDEGILVETVKSVAALRTDWALPELVAGVEACGEPKRRALLVWALAAFPESAEAQNLLRRLMTADPDPEVRAHAIEAMGSFRGEAAVAALLAALGTGSPSERFWALYGLGNVAPSGVSAVIARYLADHSEVPGFGTVSSEAEWALARIRDRGATERE